MINASDDHAGVDEETLFRIRANAGNVSDVMSQHAGFTLGYDDASIEWLDGFIERQRQRQDLADGGVSGLVNTLGSFLGEALCQAYGGEWRDDGDHGLRVAFSNGNSAYPFNKVRKQFENGADDSIYSFYTTVAVMATMEAA